MNWMMAGAETTRRGGGAHRFPHADVTVSLTNLTNGGCPRIVAAISAACLDRAVLRQGDRVDLGIDPSSNSLRVVLDEMGPFTLHSGKGKGKSWQKLHVSAGARPGWRISKVARRPVMPCTHVDVKRGEIIARLPASWEALWRGGLA